MPTATRTAYAPAIMSRLVAHVIHVFGEAAKERFGAEVRLHTVRSLIEREVRRGVSFGLVRADGCRYVQSSYQLRDALQFAILPERVIRRYTHLVLAQDTPNGLTCTAVIRVCFQNGQITHAQVLNGKTVERYSAEGKLLGTSSTDPTLLSLAGPLRRLGAKRCAKANESKPAHPTVKYLVSIWQVLFKAEAGRIAQLVATGKLTARTQLDRDSRGWNPIRHNESYWGLFGQDRLARCKISALGMHHQVIGLEEYGSHRLSVYVELGTEPGAVQFSVQYGELSVSFFGSARRLINQPDDPESYTTRFVYDVTKRDERAEVVRHARRALKAFLDNLESTEL